MKAFFKFILKLIVVIAVIRGAVGVANWVRDKVDQGGGMFQSGLFEEALPEFRDLVSLRDHLYNELQAGETEVSFIYSGEEELSGGLVSRMLGLARAGLSRSGDRCRITMYPRVGVRIVDAWKREDTSELTEDEKRALQCALDMVASARAQAGNEWEVELLLHDMLIERISYYTEEEKNAEDRYLSVVGALVDGRANCQGYADAFYTVATIAGFQVEEMSVDTPDGTHRVNTIYLQGKWYVVDVTHNDHENGKIFYKLFNAGMDVIDGYWWGEELELHPIAATGSPDWYYYYRRGIAFDSASAFASYVANDWAATGKTQYRGMVRGMTDGGALKEVLSAALKKTGKAYSYRYSCSEGDKNCFFIVTFEKKAHS